jgi:hypothetical protein
MVLRRSPNATLVTQDMLTQASTALLELPERPQENLSLREAVIALHEPITEALGKGYSYEDVAQMLEKQGISIAPASLKHYLARSKRENKPASGTKTRRRRTASESTAVETPVEAALAAEPVPKRGRCKASAVENPPELEVAEPTAEAVPKKRGRRSVNAAVPTVAKQATRTTTTKRSVPVSSSTRKRAGKA